MIKGLAFAGAAAATTFLALLAMTHLLSQIPDSAATAALIQKSDEADSLAEQERIRGALTEQLRKQQQEIAALRRDLDAAQAEKNAARKGGASSTTSITSNNDAVAGQRSEAWQSEFQILKDKLAAATAEIETRDKRTKVLQSRIDQLDEELQQKDGSLKTMIARLTAAEKPNSGSTLPEPSASLQASPQISRSAEAKNAGGNPSKTDLTGSGRIVPKDATVSDGIAAYRDGRFEDAFAIWNALAQRANAQAQFHLGALYFEGRGISPDRDAARKWLERALEGGDTRAKGLLQLLRPASLSG